LLDHGEPADAEKQFREVIAQDHERNLLAAASAHSDLAQLALARADARTALAESTEALRIVGQASDRRDPHAQARLWRIHAQVLARSGDFAAARDYAQRALDAFRRDDDPASAEISKSATALAEIDRQAKQ